MRVGVCCALALALLAVTSALRTQVEGSSRISRRPPLHSSTEESPASQKTEDVSTPRSRGSRRREETTPRHIVRSRTRTRPPEIKTVTESEAKPRSVNNERFDLRRTYSRAHNRSQTDEDTPKANVIRSRQRYSRPAPTPSSITTKTSEVNSSTIDESKIEVINSTLKEIPKIIFKEDEPAITEFRRRSSTSQINETVAPRRRGRINIRTREQSDLAGSGTTNSISISEKGPTTDKMTDLRNSRKLRYKSRLSETDTNLTGLGIKASNEVTQSSQKESSASQETQPAVPSNVENVQQSTETNPLKTTTLKVMRIVRRPIQRGKGIFQPSPSEAQPKKRSDEVSEDDNYPEPFKALLQAQNASTQASSPTRESLSVKASQKVYKTFTPTQQSTFTSSSRNKYSRLRPKLNIEEEPKKEDMREGITAAPRQPTKQAEYKFRSSYTTRNRKLSTTTSTTTAENTIEESSEKPIYKFNRKFKGSTTETPKTEQIVNSKRVETNNFLKRTLNRSSYYTRRNSSNSNVNTPSPNEVKNINIESAIDSISKHKETLPKTSYYSRQRNNNKINITSTEEPFRESNNVIETADRKYVDNSDMPLIFTLLKPTNILQTEDNAKHENQTDKAHKMFVIAVTSKESQETSTENEMTSKIVEEIKGKPVIDVLSTPKYHATYSVPQVAAEGEIKEVGTPSILPPIKNILTGKYGRAKTNLKSQKDEVSDDAVKRNRGSGKFSDTISKSTEDSSNGINPDTEKSKHRFSSKYRASYLDKPIYRATVPTVTPSTAWLKFFVTDRLLTKFVVEPNWFEEDYNDVTTPMSRLNITLPITHESSIELIEGREFQIGPDMNAISFTQTRSPAELLKQSESLVKQTQVMNVEASQYSQSVTVSIFDALAEILTSTPRNRLSSTTEVIKKQNINTDSIQTLNGVSNKSDINSGVLLGQNTLSLNVNTNTNTNVQNIDQPLNVNNPLVTESATLALMTSEAPSTLTPTSTPVSARRPFAFKVLYADTNPTDKLTTAPEPTSNQPSTDNPTMISSSTLNLKDSSSAVANKPPTEQSTASHVLSLRTTTMLPSVDEILLNSISSAAKQDMVISSMASSTRQPTILTLDIDPETKQIRTEKPGEGNNSAVFKFIPINEVTVRSQNSNVLKLASSKSPTTTETSQTMGVIEETVTESSTQTPQIPSLMQPDDPTTTLQVTAGTAIDTNTESTTMLSLLTTTPTETNTTPLAITELLATMITTTESPVTKTTEVTTTTVAPVIKITEATTTTAAPMTTSTEATTTAKTTETLFTTTAATKTTSVTTTTAAPLTKSFNLTTVEVTKEDSKRYQEDAALLEAFLSGNERIPQKPNYNILDQTAGTTSINMKTTPTMTTNLSEEDNFLQALLSAAGKNPTTLTIPNIGSNIKVNIKAVQTTTVRSIEDDIRQFQEDTELLKALLQATGQNPANFNIPTLDISTTAITSTLETITTTKPEVVVKLQTTTPSIEADAKQLQLQENAKLLQMLLQATGQNNANLNVPVITGITSNVRIASNPYTTSLGSSPTTPINIRPIYTINTSPKPKTTTLPSNTVTVPTTLQPRTTDSTTIRISTTFPPFNKRSRQKTTTAITTESTTVPTARRMPLSRFAVTTEIPTSSTFSVEEDLAFLNNLKSVLNTNTNADPEAALANRIIALAVEKSLKEIKTGKGTERPGKAIIFTTSSTTTTTTTTTPRPTTSNPSTPSIEDDIRQFQEDTKLLQALLKATGQDPSKLNLPTLPNLNTNVSPGLSPEVNNDLNLLSNLLASPSPLNEPFDSLTQEPNKQVRAKATAATRPFGAKIAVKDDLTNIQDDGKLLQTLIQLQSVQETTTLKSKIVLTGQSTDEALKKLIQQTKPTSMVPEATKMPLAISTEYGKSNDALLAALLKEQGFGPTTASSLDEQLRLAALLNQVVVTPKARRTTTQPPPPPPAPRRPILDGLAWLWQQWRETGTGTAAKRPNRRPEAAPTASVAASQTSSNRVNWFGSGPFVGNADDRPSSNRIPLEPPRAVTSEQSPGRGQLVSAAINVTRAFSQFLGAAIQGAAQTVQSVIRAGQRAATDVYSNGSGASG